MKSLRDLIVAIVLGILVFVILKSLLSLLVLLIFIGLAYLILRELFKTS
ncbi:MULTISPECIES: hypothetical protein [Streptococcus]|nr:hypothetical protein [Streptococcus orisratti]MCI7676846.1 hypothetical protein [Streptococcus orisratti]MDY4001849.1 hypothetical protein [Streptococcus orisratti]